MFTATTLQASLTVKDIAQSLAWYRDVLGFTLERAFGPEGKPHAIRLAAGAVKLLIVQDDGKKGLDRVKGEGISLSLTTAENVDAVAQRVKDAGGTLASEPQDIPGGGRGFRLADPDGFRLAIISGGA